jgi:hypothetical protein
MVWFVQPLSRQGLGFAIDIQHYYPPAFRKKFLRGREANAPRGAGNDDYFPHERSDSFTKPRKE